MCGCLGGGRVKAKEVLEWVGGLFGGLMGLWAGGWGAVLTLVLNGAFVLVCVCVCLRRLGVHCFLQTTLGSTLPQCIKPRPFVSWA